MPQRVQPLPVRAQMGDIFHPRGSISPIQPTVRVGAPRSPLLEAYIQLLGSLLVAQQPGVNALGGLEWGGIQPEVWGLGRAMRVHGRANAGAAAWGGGLHATGRRVCMQVRGPTGLLGVC